MTWGDHHYVGDPIARVVEAVGNVRSMLAVMKQGFTHDIAYVAPGSSTYSSAQKGV
jgi:hypothetical protein